MPQATQAKKLVSVLATSVSMTGANKEAQKVILEQIPCIHYLVQFQKYKEVIRALINSGSKINVITPAYTFKLGFQVQRTDVGAQKIDSSSLQTFGMVIDSFQIEDKLIRVRFFQKLFSLAETIIEVVLGMPFLTFSNANI